MRWDHYLGDHIATSPSQRDQTGGRQTLCRLHCNEHSAKHGGCRRHWGKAWIEPRFRPALSSAQRGERWHAYRNALGQLGCGVDLVLQGQNDAAKLAGSRWHVMKDVARHGVVLYASL